jgi:hypothetical protein
MIQNTPMIPGIESTKSNVRWFSINSCVVYNENSMSVIVGANLVGVIGRKDTLARNLLLVGLAQESKIKKGVLAKAFMISEERLRKICRAVDMNGLSGIPSKVWGGRVPKIDGDVLKKTYTFFDKGLNANQAFMKAGEELGLSYRSFCRIQEEWKQAQAASAETMEEESQLTLPMIEQGKAAETRTSESAEEIFSDADDSSSDEEEVSDPIRSGKMVQHAGGLMLAALVYSYGLHEAAQKGWEQGRQWMERLRMAIDAVILAFGIGQRCVEGVRRLETKTAPILLRTNHMPSESWVRRVIKRYVDDMGAAKLHLRMTGVYLERSRYGEEDPAVFYMDNHMRPYTGKFTLRKGWRMQDKRVKPGATDYYVHDEDGRPVFRVDVPMHDSLTDWLSPIMEVLRGGLGKDQRILVAFDRAGSFPEQMAALRDEGFGFVTYERKPYPLLPRTAFDESVKVDGEEILVHEERMKNLGKGRGRVRRIALLMPDGHQVNLLAVSEEKAARLIEVMLGRWVQENGFKHGNERWGINQLDRRKVIEYAPNTVIPNPARRRLENALKLLREQEGRLRRELARLHKKGSRREKLEEELKQSLEQQAELEAQRPNFPKHAPLEKTELAGELVHHESHCKTFLDTVRIACANAESDLAVELAPHLVKPREAKKSLANLFASPGDIRVNRKSISITLHPTGRKDERKAFQTLCEIVTDWNLILPDDPDRRPIRFISQL